MAIKRKPLGIVDVSIRRPVFIVMINFSLNTLGLVGYFNLSVDLLPNVEFPNIVVVSNYPGASSEEMETLITRPLENTLGTSEGLDTITSITREGFSLIFVVFKVGVDLKFSELEVRNKVAATMPQLPTDLVAPTVNRFSTEDIPIAFCSVSGNRSRADITDLINNQIQTLIETANGVGGINVIGGLNKTVNVDIDKSLLLSNGITWDQVLNAIQARNISIPAGLIYGKEKYINVRVYGKADVVKDFGEIPITSKGGVTIRIKDIATVKFGTEDETTRARVNGQSAVIFAIFKESDQNTVRVVDNVYAKIPDIQKALPGDVKIKVIFDTAQSIRRSLTGVEQNILIGALLAIVVVFLFLGNFRSTIITAIALPNSLLGAFFLIFIAGFTINTMTLLSLSLAVGLLIDDSIVVRENIFRHMELGEPPLKAASNGTSEVGMAVLSTTAAIMSVFIPISFMQGISGQFFRQFGLTVAFALAISLLDAFTTAPMFSAYWYKKTSENPKGMAKVFREISNRWNKLYTVFNNFYHGLLKWSLNHKSRIIISVIVLFAFSVFLARFIGQNFVNYNDNGVFNVNLELYPGAALDKIDYYTKQVEKFLATQPDIDSYFSQIGRVSQSHLSQINVVMKPLNKRKISTLDMVKKTREFLRKNLDYYVISRVTESSSVAGGSGAIGGFGNFALQLNIYGDDFAVLDKLSQEFTNVMMATPGATDINTTNKPGIPEMVIKLDNLKAEKFGITAQSLGTMLQDLITGIKVSTYTIGEYDYYVVLRLAANQRNSVNDFDNFMITTKTGQKVLLSSFTKISYSSSPYEIRRYNRVRTVRIFGNITKGYSMTKVLDSLKKNFASRITLPSGYSYEFVGQQKDFHDLVLQIMVSLGLSLVFMYMILASLYNSFIQPIYLMLSIPLAIIGSFLALLITGIDLDIYGYIGILLVFGLVAKNAILLIDFTNKMREDGMSIREALLHAGPIRLRPILMTTFAMIFGMLPLALGLDEGSSGRQALPITVIGGLLTSTFLTLVVIPTVYEWTETRFEKRKLLKGKLAGKGKRKKS